MQRRNIQKREASSPAENESIEYPDDTEKIDGWANEETRGPTDIRGNSGNDETHGLT